MDEMSTKKQVQVEPSSNKLVGVTTLKEMGCSSNPSGFPASKALFFMLVSLDGKWKYPVRYELTTTFKGEDLKPVLTEVLIKTYAAGIRIRGVVFDGLGSNFTFAEVAGAELKDLSSLINFIRHPCSGSKVYVIPYPVLMLKLVRIFMAQIGEVYLSGFRQPALWVHLIAVNDFQASVNFRFGNRLADKHIHFENFIMKVGLAAQTLSNSVADAMKYLQEFIGLKKVK